MCVCVCGDAASFSGRASVLPCHSWSPIISCPLWCSFGCSQLRCMPPHKLGRCPYVEGIEVGIDRRRCCCISAYSDRRFFCKEKRMPSTAYCLVCLHPTMRKKDCRLRVLGVHKQQQQGMYRNFLFLVRSAVESSSARRMTLPVYQLESFRNVDTDNPADLVVRISRFGAVPSVRLA